MRIRNVRVGPAFSRGAEMLNAYLVKHEISQTAFGESVGVAGAVVTRWVHGDRRPGLRFAILLEKEARIPLAAWNQKPTRTRIAAA